MAKQDFYDLLGVARGAGADEIKKAYRKLAMQYHPDRNPGDHAAEHKFKEINEAYDVLKDEQKRAAYDRFGHAAFDGGAGPRGPGGADFSGGFADIFEEMFGDFMGGRRGGQRAQAGRGSDVRFNLEITLEEAFLGKQATVKVPSSVGCEVCDGSGAEPGSQPVTCPTCGGAGRVRASQGFFTVERTCPGCGGQGRVIKNPCRNCSGSGRVRKDKTLKVDIPPGVDDGTRIRLSNEGESGMRGAPPGDLYIFLSVRPHALFQRDGADLFCKAPIPMSTAALGGPIEIPAIDGGRAKITVPAGTQSGARFRLRGKGMSVLRSAGRGDMYVELQVETPVNLSKRQRELLEEFEREGGGGTSPESQGFFAKVKEFFKE
ncbi:molecular chaperone DnaJ [Mycobacterium sp. KBS0706]|uniref:molecular chaperone DnaJ n=1 Tax=Mycobacterium sp. KBS0706 TaxID=2578109 RepID=UPI00110FB488|nr:molecular chaperone DnaJ [Mycobacterium sp. KBS0706]TSD84521.1 molecular chaperone DnaJ [Mycobacterium sp. KBS0706]